MSIIKPLSYLGMDVFFGSKQTKKILHSSPITVPNRADAEEVKLFVFNYNASTLEKRELHSITECLHYKENDQVSWINVEGLRKADVEVISNHYGIHPLIAEDILSINQRPKMDEVEGIMLCLLNMLYFNEENCSVEQEQVSIVFGQKFLISFQEDATRDVFNPIRDKLNFTNTKLRQRNADYLCYVMLDMIVDNYFMVMEKLGDKIEQLEETVIRGSNLRTLASINQLRKELLVLKRNIAPVRELLNGILRSESELLDDRTTKYFKDVYDHIVQAFDIAESYRDITMNMQDLHINNVNMRMNEVMKVMAIVTCLLAPATVIGGIFGMNFDRIPWLHKEYGFFIAVGLMLIIPVWMLWRFKKRGWF